MTQEEAYVNALNKAREAKDAFDKLTDKNKERLAREVLGVIAFNNLVKHLNNNR